MFRIYVNICRLIGIRVWGLGFGAVWGLGFFPLPLSKALGFGVLYWLCSAYRALGFGFGATCSTWGLMGLLFDGGGGGL